MKLSAFINDLQRLCAVTGTTFDDVEFETDHDVILITLNGLDFLTPEQEDALEGRVFNSEEFDCIAMFI